MNRRIFCRTIAGVAAAGIAGLKPWDPAMACTRVLWNTNGLAVTAGRTMDWPEFTQPVLTVFPRGLKRNGGRAGPQTVVQTNPARWQSRHGSLVTTCYGIGSVDGVKEHGLAGHLLYLNATDFGTRDIGKPGLHAGLWLQYALDNARTVTEALAILDNVQIVMVEAHGHKATVHLAMEDATGDSAILEHIDGKVVVHHGRSTA
ncbi:MAG TPA: linear amide C-N hydrolase [Rhodopila sp.]|nr:linear amide C-N hydrolase [Rhodopila sp.]